MMSSTKLALEPLMEVHPDLESDFMDGATISDSVYHQWVCLLYIASEFLEAFV